MAESQFRQAAAVLRGQRPFAISTGNTVVLNAASIAPQTASRMLELLIEPGLPKGVVNIVT
jgi:malonate-semialdehyde dehydrogenase (acetylating)/methylmalonate-semialdehyde dehydrogenase